MDRDDDVEEPPGRVLHLDVPPVRLPRHVAVQEPPRYPAHVRVHVDTPLTVPVSVVPGRRGWGRDGVGGPGVEPLLVEVLQPEHGVAQYVVRQCLPVVRYPLQHDPVGAVVGDEDVQPGRAVHLLLHRVQDGHGPPLHSRVPVGKEGGPGGTEDGSVPGEPGNLSCRD